MDGHITRHALTDDRRCEIITLRTHPMQGLDRVVPAVQEADGASCTRS